MCRSEELRGCWTKGSGGLPDLSPSGSGSARLAQPFRFPTTFQALMGKTLLRSWRFQHCRALQRLVSLQSWPFGRAQGPQETARSVPRRDHFAFFVHQSVRTTNAYPKGHANETNRVSEGQ